VHHYFDAVDEKNGFWGRSLAENLDPRSPFTALVLETGIYPRKGES